MWHMNMAPAHACVALGLLLLARAELSGAGDQAAAGARGAVLATSAVPVVAVARGGPAQDAISYAGLRELAVRHFPEASDTVGGWRTRDPFIVLFVLDATGRVVESARRPLRADGPRGISVVVREAFPHIPERAIRRWLVTVVRGESDAISPGLVTVGAAVLR